MTKSPQTILVVEDEQVVAMDLELTLRALGFCVIAAHTGCEALAQVQQRRPDLVLMDIRLQGDIDGVTTAAQIRAWADIPIIYLTAYSDDDTRQRAGDTAPYGYLIKPFDERTLQSTIEMALIRHAADRQLRVSEQWFRTTLASIGDAVVTTDEQASVTYLNQAAIDLLGVTPDAALGRPVSAVVPLLDPATGAPVDHPVERALASSEQIMLDDELLLRAPDGHELWIADSAAPIRLSPAAALGAVMVFRDTTARRQAERARLEIQQRQQEVQHLERLRVLSGGVAHDLNNLLTGLLGYAELARIDGDNPTLVDEMLVEMVKITRRATDLTHDLLAYAGRGRLVRKPVDLNQIVHDVVRELGGTRLRDVPVTLDLDPQLPAIEGDQSQLHQVALNLVVNAVEACQPARGSISITTRLRVLPADATLPALADGTLPAGRYVALDVQDTGVGMDAATRARIFEPFFSTKLSGRGLGLAIVLDNIRSHGGTVLVTSAVEVGTQFTVVLPALTEPPAPEPPPAPDSAWQGAGTILVIDDDPTVRHVAERLLTLIGFSVLTASSGVEGLAIFEQGAPPISCVVLDLTMPGMDGTEVAQRLRALAPSVPILLMSGYSQDDPAELLARASQMRFLAKPFTLAALRSQLELLRPALGLVEHADEG